MPMIADAAGGECKWKILIRHFAGEGIRNSANLGVPVFGIKSFVGKQSGGTYSYIPFFIRPLHRSLLFDYLVTQSADIDIGFGGEFGVLGINFGGVFKIKPFVAHLFGKAANDLAIRYGFARRVKHF